LAPALAQLGLGADELEALRRGGFVARERRRGRVYYRLRFRVAGTQVTRYLGSNPDFALQVRRAIEQWQVPRRLDLQLGRLAREASRRLRRAKQRLAPEMRTHGLVFHGLSIRRKRAEPHSSFHHQPDLEVKEDHGRERCEGTQQA
jgi:hypothetical protein